LYRLPRIWAEYDAQRKCFPDGALARLQSLVVGKDSKARSTDGAIYGDGTPLNGNQAERDAYRAYVTAMGKPPENVTALRQWYMAQS
jgi:hypothetical protein